MEDFGCTFGSKYMNINDHNSSYLTVVNKSRFVTVPNKTVFTFTATSCFGMRVFQVLCINNSNFKPNLVVFKVFIPITKALILFNKCMFNMGPNYIRKMFSFCHKEYALRGFCKFNQPTYNSRYMHRSYQ